MSLFQYCPYCATPLSDRLVEGKMRRSCTHCRFIQFPDPKVAVVALVHAGGRVLLVRRGVEPARGSWALPGGYLDAGELPHEALVREVKEEAGLAVTAGPLLEILPMVGAHAGLVMVYQASVVAGRDGQLPEPVGADDADGAGWFAAAEIPQPVAFASTELMLQRWQAGHFD